MAFLIGPFDRWFSFSQLCDANNPGTLIYFTGQYVNPVFPYAYINRQPNSPSCTGAGQVCDIQFVGIPQVAAPTNQYSSDGSITVQATSSYGVVRYGLSDAVYLEMINTTGIFMGLPPGVYNVYARDSHNCLASVKVTVTATPVYNFKYRLQYKDIVGLVIGEVQILERDYNGDSIDIDGGEQPIVLSKPQTDLQNKFEVLRPTFATLMLMSKSNYQFLSLFTQDDRKYQVKFLKNSVLRWSGFVTPSVFSENMALPSYPTQINVTDNIEELGNIPFLDNSIFQGNSSLEQLTGGNPFQGNFSLVQIVGMVLKKLNLDIHMRFAINMLEQTLSIAPTEAYIDASTFFDYDQNQVWNCDKVLKTVLAPFGAFVIQDDGVWNIIRLEEQCAAYNYKEYDLDANLITTGTNNKVIDIEDPSLRLGAVFLDTDQSTLEINPAYGIFDLKHNLIAKKSLLFDFDFSPFNFDGSDFNGWTIDRSHQSGVKITSERVAQNSLADQINTILGGNLLSVNLGSFAFTVENLDTPSSVYSDPTVSGVSGLGGGQYIVLHSKPQPIEYRRDGLTFSFNYRFNSTGENFLPPFARVKYRIKLFRTGLGPVLYYTDKANTWITSERWNEVNTDTLDTDGQFKISLPISLVSADLVNDSIQISFKIGGNTWVDAFTTSHADPGTGAYATLMTAIASIPTVNLPLSSKIKAYGYYNFGGTIGWQTGYFFYDLRDANGVDFPLVGSGHPFSYPSQIIPSDATSSGLNPNNVYWNLIGPSNPASIYDPSFDDSFLRAAFQRIIYKFYLDDVILEFKPLYSDAPVLEEIGLINNQNFRENLSVELDAADLPDTQIDSAKYIYRNYFRDASGNPTRDWKRTGITEKNTLQKILLKQLSKQYTSPSYKITGAFRGYNDLGFLTILKHTQPAPSISLVNPELNGVGAVTTGWTNVGSGTVSWANSSNKAQTVLGSTDLLSQILCQSAALDFEVNERFTIEFSCARSSSGTRIDELHFCLLDNLGNIVQDLIVAAFKNDSSLTKKIGFNCQQNCSNIGFYVKRAVGGQGATYAMDYFRLTALTIVRFYGFNMVDIDDHANHYDAELVQIMPMLSGSSSGVDDSGDNGGGVLPAGGGGFSGAYSSGYGSGFNSVLS